MAFKTAGKSVKGSVIQRMRGKEGRKEGRKEKSRRRDEEWKEKEKEINFP